MQFGCAASELIIHVSDQPVAPSFGHEAGLGRRFDRLLLGLQREQLVLPRRSHDAVAVRERLDLLGGIGPVLADVRLLLLEQVDSGLELLVVELVRIVDAEIRLVRLQVHRGVRDVDRIVVDADLPLYFDASPDPGFRPRGRVGLDLIRVPHQEVRPSAVGDAVVDTVHGVVGWSFRSSNTVS